MANKVENSAGLILVDGSNLLDWAVSKNIGCSFSVPPDATGTPISQRWYAGTLEVNIATSAWTLRLIDTYTSIMWINSTESGIWKGWKPLATATPPAVYDLPLAAGWSVADQWSASEYRKNQFKEVFVEFTLRSTVAPTSGMTLATLPEGYRPAKSRHAVCAVIFSDYSHGVGHVDVGGDGAIKLWLDNYNGSQTVLVLYCTQINFMAA
ncbi:hypothetical protein RWV98_15865 [Agathobaculum sp. NTUH-O15-33]|uniref:hypothetical protein n=1 Tax=Agathobaculum sp. NTUH-O15-33 TaxID=3079302 RepID=UPI0029585A7F|nr:hypothetical protein [Agathobaculum sp. NTUH-O15-33]WNX84039.1 hypothetical protein RWV98_15865 [Agathobaculum sp. NTUH-O15-33]